MLLNSEKLFQQANAILHNNNSSREELSSGFDIVTALLNNDYRSPILLFTLGCFSMRKKQNALAIMFFEMAIKASDTPSSTVTSWINLGIMHRVEQRHDMAMACYKTAIRLIPEEPGEDLKVHFEQCKCDALANMAGLYISIGKPDEGLKIIEEVEERWPDNPNTIKLLSNKSLLLLEKGEYEEGFKIYGNVENRPLERGYPTEPILWDGTKDKVVIVTGEQGIGDEIMFASMISDLMKDCKLVIMDAHLRLADIFRRSFGIPVYGTREFNALAWTPPCKLDYKIPIGSLCQFYRKKTEDFPGSPFLIPDESQKTKYKARLKELGDKPCVGISWKGGTKVTNKSVRTIPLDLLEPLLANDKVNWISLQYHEMAQHEIAEFEKRTGIKIHHWKEVLDNYDLTAALVSNLDLVISVPQSVVHLAGALGIPTWQLCPKQAMWQMGVYGKDMPWYKNTKNIWQEHDGVWEPVIEQVIYDLSNFQPEKSSC